MKYYRQYALFNKKVDPDAIVPASDMWLFTEPFHVFPLDTQMKVVHQIFRELQPDTTSTRNVGKAKIVSRVELRSQKVIFEGYQPVQTPLLTSSTSLTSAKSST